MIDWDRLNWLFFLFGFECGEVVWFLLRYLGLVSRTNNTNSDDDCDGIDRTFPRDL